MNGTMQHVEGQQAMNLVSLRLQESAILALGPQFDIFEA